MFTYAVDQQLSLKFPAESDADALFAQVEADRIGMRRWLPWVDQTASVADERAYLRFAREQIVQDKLWLALMVVDHQVAGMIDIHNLDAENQSGEIGYWIGPDFRGHGIVTRALKAVEQVAFTELGLHRLGLVAAVENLPSQAVAKRRQFVQEGVLRDFLQLDGQAHDVVLFSKLATDSQ